MIWTTHISSLFPYSTLFFFFFNDTATTEIYTLSLHDALPICSAGNPANLRKEKGMSGVRVLVGTRKGAFVLTSEDRKSTRLNSSHLVISYAVFCLKKKEHTSELQSPCNLVCRLLLEKKKDNKEVLTPWQILCLLLT